MSSNGRRSVGRRVVLAGCVVAAVAAFAPAAQAADCTKFASASGSDTGAGTLASPWRSAQKLVDSLAAGQTGCLRGGSYSGVSFSRSGSATAPITLRSYPTERARLYGSVTVRSNWITLSELDIEGDGSMNTIKVYAADTVIQDNRITNKMRGRSCMMLGSSTAGTALRTIVRRNRFSDCGATANGNKDHSIYAAHLTEGRIEDNVFSNSAGKTLSLYPNMQRTVVAHNVIDGGPDTVRGGIGLGGFDLYAPNNNTIEHNVITYPADYGIYSNWGSLIGIGNVARMNCIWGAGNSSISTSAVSLTGNLTADPRFLDRSARDYRLAPDSPCLPIVGYDTAAKLLGSPTPTPEPTPTPTPPTGAPTVTLSSPLAGSTFTRSLRLTATATDDRKVAKVEFLLDGQLIHTEYGAPYDAYWSAPSTLTYGTHQIVAKAHDDQGNTTTSTPATITRIR